MILNQVMEDFLCHSKLTGLSTHIVFPGNTSNSYPLYPLSLETVVISWNRTLYCHIYIKRFASVDSPCKDVSWTQCIIYTPRKFVMEIFSSERRRTWDVWFLKCTGNRFYASQEHIFLVNNLFNVKMFQIWETKLTVLYSLQTEVWYCSSLNNLNSW